METISKEKHDDNIEAYLLDMGRQKESGNKVLYSNWDLTPIRQGIDAFLDRHPSVEDDFLRVYSEIYALVDLLQVRRIQI